MNLSQNEQFVCWQVIVYTSETLWKYAKQASESSLPWQAIAFADTTYKYSKTDQIHGTWKSLEIIVNILIYILTKRNPVNVAFMKRPKVSKGLRISNTLLNNVVMQQMVIELYFLMTEACYQRVQFSSLNISWTVTGPRVLCQPL